MPDVLLVDDEELFRCGLRDWLATLDGINVVGEAKTAEECLDFLERQTADVAIIDVRLPGISGVSLVEKIRANRPGVKTLILSGSSNVDLVYQAFAGGANGFLPKQVSSEELDVAIREIQRGNWYLSPLLVSDVIQSALHLRQRLETEQEDDSFNPLTGRERELLKLIAEGHTFTEIGKHLSLNSRSVERLKSKLETKLNAEGLSDLIREAIRLGLVEA